MWGEQEEWPILTKNTIGVPKNVIIDAGIASVISELKSISSLIKEHRIAPQASPVVEVFPSSFPDWLPKEWFIDQICWH